MTGGTIAELVATTIVERAADRVFAFPGGGSNLEVIDALERLGVAVLLTRSEGGAALMAATYADLTGRPAVVLVGLGPGVSSVVNGLAHALLDQSSVIVISDRFGGAERDSTGHQELDHIALLAPVAKWQAELTPDCAAALLERALTMATTPPRGPVHLELPRDAALAPAQDIDVGFSLQPSEDPALPERSPLTTRLAAARRPIVLIGDEALEASQDDLVRAVERVGGPALSTYKAKGAFPEDHPLWCGILTNAALERPLLDEADVILAIGLDPVELLPAPWAVGAPVVALRRHTEHVPGYSPQHVLVGDLSPMLKALAAELRGSESTWSHAEVAARRARLFEALRIGSPEFLTAMEVVASVQAVAPEGTTVTVDAGAHMFAATWGWRASRPRGFLMSNGHATMGYAVPAAIAAALARPGEPVIAFTGDGGFLLHGNELETAARVGARLVVIVLNDSGLSLIRTKQEERSYRRTAVDFGPVDCANFARSLGAAGAVVSTVPELRAAVIEGLREPVPTVLDARISGDEYGELQRVIRGTGASKRRSEECVCTG
ncbi:MAG TPA: thiamine pyrophosphate-binding protein [Solirubrobacteraceae bacterium]|nr:thiamine pyrophosphate-binding protein [Solirubrobacteraceae bacterium]